MPGGDPFGLDVFVATESWTLTGVNVFCANLVRGLRRRGVAARILMTEHDTALVQQAAPALPLPKDVPFEYLPVTRSDGWGAHWGATIRFLEERAPCIYIPNSDWRHSCVCPLLSDRVGVVGIVHSDDPLHYDHVSRLGRYWNAIVGVSRTLASRTAELDPGSAGRIVTIPIGVDVAARLPERPSDPGRPLEIIYHGVLKQHQKRILDLPGIMESLARRGVPARLTLVGRGPEEQKLRQASGQLVEQGRIRFLGVRPNDEVLELLERADAFVLTSEFEGMPNALLEAMGRGCVPVVTDIRSGIPEVVRDDFSGYLLPVGDVEAFAERLALLQRDPARRRRLAENAYRAVSSGGYQIRDMARDYESVFARVSSEMRRRDYRRPRGALSLPPAEVEGVSVFPVECPHTLDGIAAFPSPRDRVAFAEQITSLLEARPDLASGSPWGSNPDVRLSRAGWVVANRDGPALCVATSTRNVDPESTFILAHMSRLPARVEVLSGFEHPPLSDDGRWVAPTLADRVARAVARRALRLRVASAQDAAIARFLRRGGFRAVLAEYAPTAARLLTACRLARVPLIVHFHGYDASVRGLIEHYRSYGELFEGAAAVIAVSKDMEERLLRLGAPRERLHLNHYGVDTALFDGADPGRAGPGFIAVGRFVEKKAPELTLLAFQRARQQVPEASLVMIGDGPLLGPCQRMSRALGLEQAVSFRGVQSPAAVAASLAGARAFVQHSVTGRDGDSEGTPLTVLEASAAGLPVVSTRHAGIRDVVVEEETGFLVDEGDADAMAGHMVRLARDPELATRVGSAGRRRCLEQFTIQGSIAKLWDIISIASAASPAGRDRPGA